MVASLTAQFNGKPISSHIINTGKVLISGNPNHWSSWATVSGKVEFQQKARHDGRAFELEVIGGLRRAGWTIRSTRTRFLGIEIDIIAAPPGGPDCLIECKGGTLLGRSGLARTDTVKKSIGTAWTLRQRQWKQKTKPMDYLLVTSMMPKIGTQGSVMLEEAARDGLFTHLGLTSDIVRWGMIFDSFYQRHGGPHYYHGFP